MTRSSAIRPTRARIPTEDQEQAALIRRRDFYVRQIPALKWLHHVPNGGQRHKIVAAKLVGQGVVKGIPDLVWDLRTKKHAGLRIEMKRRGNKPTEEQAEYGEWLQTQGFKFVVCYTADEAWQVVMDYWKESQE